VNWSMNARRRNGISFSTVKWNPFWNDVFLGNCFFACSVSDSPTESRISKKIFFLSPDVVVIAHGRGPAHGCPARGRCKQFFAHSFAVKSACEGQPNQIVTYLRC
jgi:hypothetical protein